MNKKVFIGIAGGLIGIISVALVVAGNPGNMGFCIACFLRDIAGALKLQTAAPVQYMRPEILGLVFGALIMALAGKQFKARGGSAPVTRFVLGFITMVGALMFLGCPLRMMLRIGGGDLNAVIGLVGFIVGILFGVVSLKKGFSLRRTFILGKAEAWVFPGIIVLMLIMISVPVLKSLLAFSEEGPGSMHPAVYISLAAGLIVGALAQRTRLCTVGGIRDAVMFKDTYLLVGFLAIIISCVIMNLIFGKFHLGFAEQPVAHADGVWNFLGMVLVGWAGALLGGCPLRQVILSAEGNVDSVVTVFGLFAGAAFCHNFSLASSAAGPSPNGKVAVIAGFVIVLIITIVNVQRGKKAATTNS